jgi:hypothetical protein
VIRGCIWPHRFHAAAASCCSASRLGEASAHCPLAVWPSDSRIPAKGPVSNGTGATHSPADASVPVAVAVPSPAQLGAFKPESTSPSEAISDCTLSPNDIDGRQARRMLCQWPATTIIPSFYPTHSSCEPDSPPDHFLGDLRGFSLASCSLDASSTPHLLSLIPHSGAAPLLPERHCLLFRPA